QRIVLRGQSAPHPRLQLLDLADAGIVRELLAVLGVVGAVVDVRVERHEGHLHRVGACLRILLAAAGLPGSPRSRCGYDRSMNRSSRRAGGSAGTGTPSPLSGPRLIE